MNPGAVISNYGSVTLGGGTGAGNTTIAVPLQNYGNLYVNGGTWTFSQADVSGNDLSMYTGGTIRLNSTPTITLADQYTQSGGVFDVATSYATFNVTKNAANFNGGLLEFTTNPGYGVSATTNINFNGGTTLSMTIEGESPWNYDQITCNNCSITGSNTISVSDDQMPTEYGSLWTLIASKTKIKGDFTTVTLPPDITEVAPPTTYWQCEYPP